MLFKLKNVAVKDFVKSQAMRNSARKVDTKGPKILYIVWIHKLAMAYSSIHCLHEHQATYVRKRRIDNTNDPYAVSVMKEREVGVSSCN